METIKVILPASYIPNGSKVTKATGTCIHTLLDKIVIHSDCSHMDKQEICGSNVKFIVRDGGISAIANDTELAWIASISDLQQLLDSMVSDDDK